MAQTTHLFGKTQTLNTAQETHKALVAAYETPVPPALDTSEVTDPDISFLQILLATRKSAIANGQAFALSAPPSPELVDLMVRAGFIKAEETPDQTFWQVEATA